MSQLTNAAILGLALGASVAAQQNAKGAEMKPPAGEMEKCFGIHACRGNGSCGVTKSEVDAVKAAFKNTFSQAVVHSCSASNACAAKKGHLEWVAVAKNACLKIEGGFLIEEKDGKKVVKKKS